MYHKRSYTPSLLFLCHSLFLKYYDGRWVFCDTRSIYRYVTSGRPCWMTSQRAHLLLFITVRFKAVLLECFCFLTVNVQPFSFSLWLFVPFRIAFGQSAGKELTACAVLLDGGLIVFVPFPLCCSLEMRNLMMWVNKHCRFIL